MVVCFLLLSAISGTAYVSNSRSSCFGLWANYWMPRCWWNGDWASYHETSCWVNGWNVWCWEWGMCGESLPVSISIGIIGNGVEIPKILLSGQRNYSLLVFFGKRTSFFAEQVSQQYKRLVRRALIHGWRLMRLKESHPHFQQIAFLLVIFNCTIWLSISRQKVCCSTGRKYWMISLHVLTPVVGFILGAGSFQNDVAECQWEFSTIWWIRKTLILTVINAPYRV